MESGETTEDFVFEDFSTEMMGCVGEDPYPASKYWLASMVPQIGNTLRNSGISFGAASLGAVDKFANIPFVVSTILPNSESFKEASVLPPCRICGEMASGFHYGANTCEACKGFFRRSLRRTTTYRCNGDGNCQISAATRGQCSYCRYKKCLSMGMSKEAIKTGRYTHEKKSKDLEEVRLTMMRKTFPTAADSNDGLLHIIHSIARTHLYYSRECVPDIPEREEEHLREHVMEEKVFGPLKAIPMEEYLNFYHVTGLDVDGRKEMLEGFVPLVEYNIRKLMAVAKSVPGFSDLPVEDQIQVIKNSRFEVWMILHHKQFNPGKRLFTTVHGKVVCHEDMVKLHKEDYIEALMKTQQRIKSLNLDHEEACLLAAFSMMFKDRCATLLCPTSVEAIQDLLLKCLTFWLNCKCPEHARASGSSSRFWRMVNVLIQLRTVKHYHDFEEERLIRLWFDKLQISPLIYEMWVL